MITPVKVGFDYDEPLFPWCAGAHQVCIRAGHAPEGTPTPTRWDPHVDYKIALETWIETLQDEVLRDDTFYRGPLNEGVVEDVRRLYSSGHEVHILTARGQFGIHGERIKRLTLEQIIREGLPYDSLHFVEDKVPMAKEIGLHYMVDDRDKYFEELNDAGINCYLLDTGWNQHVDTMRWDPMVGKTVDKRVFSTKQYINMILDRHGAGKPEFTENQIEHLRVNTG